MIDLELAQRLALNHLAAYERQGNTRLVLLGDRTRELPYGWVFFYQSRRYVETGDPREMLAGNAPLLVTRSGELYETGTAHPLETYLREYERSGSPVPPLAGVAVEVRIKGWRVGLQKVSVTQAIRDEAEMSLGAAKAITDAVLRGESASVPVRNWATAVRLAEHLQKLGADAHPARAPER
ncbi:MAG TPA: YrhB domain-containing protein [Longimicrobium sp.]|jgi:hypothetical protein